MQRGVLLLELAPRILDRGDRLQEPPFRHSIRARSDSGADVRDRERSVEGPTFEDEPVPDPFGSTSVVGAPFGEEVAGEILDGATILSRRPAGIASCPISPRAAWQGGERA